MKIPNIFDLQGKHRSFSKYYPVAGQLAFSAKFIPEYEVQNSKITG